MPQPIDVGSILGGRYKVTGRILASAEDDVILDGLDQVLNRPVSILVSAVTNSDNLAQSAREVATGERDSNVSILDLGSQDGATYLIAARTTPVDLLDLVVPTEVYDENVYREPFFTDTLGTEIFGSARDAAPAAAGPYVYEDNTPLTPAHPSPAVQAERPAPRAVTPPNATPAATPAVAPIAATAATTPAAVVVPPPATPPAAAPAAEPKVTLWDDDDYGFINDDHDADVEDARKAGKFPTAARNALADYDSAASGNGVDAADEIDDESDDGNAPRTGGRWLTGVIVTVLVVAALVFALSHIGSLFGVTTPVASGGDKPTSAVQPSQGAQSSPTGAPAPVVVPPAIKAITDITVYGPGVQRYDDIFLSRLNNAIDGNKGTYWPTVEFSGDTFANLIDSVDLAVELKQEATVSSVTINQIGGSGGQFNILTNSKPSLDGAVKIGSGSFTAPDFTLKAAAGVKAQYVIINFTQLPKLQPFVTYPYGLKIAEISIK